MQRFMLITAATMEILVITLNKLPEHAQVITIGTYDDHNGMNVCYAVVSTR